VSHDLARKPGVSPSDPRSPHSALCGPSWRPPEDLDRHERIQEIARLLPRAYLRRLRRKRLDVLGQTEAPCGRPVNNHGGDT